MRAVDLVGLQVQPTMDASLVVLREHDAPSRILPIFIGPAEATSIALALTGDTPPRPLAHDVMAALADALAGRVESVTVTDVRNGTFIAQIAVAGARGPQLIDARPSDAIALAVRTGARLFVEESVLDQAGRLVAELPDEDAIDDAVVQFREFLHGVEPVDFLEAAGATPPEEDAPGAGPTPPDGGSDAAPDGPATGGP